MPTFLFFGFALAIGAWGLLKFGNIPGDLVLLGTVFTPYFAMVAAFFGLAFGKLRRSAVRTRRVIGYICLLLAIAVIAVQTYEALNGWPLFMARIPGLTG